MGVYFDIFLLATYYVITAQLLSLLSYREVRWRNDETHANQWKMLLITWRYRVLAYPPQCIEIAQGPDSKPEANWRHSFLYLNKYGPKAKY